MACKLTQVTGTTVAFGTLSATLNVTAIDFGGMSRESLEDTVIGDNYRKFCPSTLIDNGELTLSVNCDPDHGILMAPTDVEETITVTFPVAAGNTTGASFEFSGFVTDVNLAGEQGEKYEGDVTVRISGEITVTAGA